MRIWSAVEYLLYLVIFLLYFEFSKSATVDRMKPNATSTLDTLTTTERSVRSPGSGNSSSNSSSRLKHTLENCRNSFSWMCLRLEVVGVLENFTERQELHLMNGISIVKDPNTEEVQTSELMAELARSYPNNPNARLNGYILSKIHNILKTHYLRFKLVDDQTVDEARSVIETGRKDKFGKKGGYEGLLAAGLMMKGTLLAIGMGGIALIAGKALITALMALTMAAVLGLKNFASSGGKSHTYEIVTKPIYTSSHSHSVSHDDGIPGGYLGHSGSGYGGYARTMNLNLPHIQR